MERKLSTATAAFLETGRAPRRFAARATRDAQAAPAVTIADLGYEADDKGHPDHSFALRAQLLGPMEVRSIKTGPRKDEVIIERERQAPVEYGPQERYLVVGNGGDLKVVIGRESEIRRAFPDQEEAHRRIISGMWGPRPPQAIFRLPRLRPAPPTP